MRKLILGAALALVLPATAVAAPSAPTAADQAADACKIEKQKTGTKLFKTTYGAKSASKAMKACVAKAVPVAQQEAKNAAHACKAEQESGSAAFAEKYGTNENNKNAFGKCVSGKVTEAMEDVAEDRAAAAQTCKTLKRDDAAAFAKAYGAGKNAFGKCVSTTARADET